MLTHHSNKPDRLNRYDLAGSGRKIPRLLCYGLRWSVDGGLASNQQRDNSRDVNKQPRHQIKATYQLVSYCLLLNSATGLIGKLMANSVVC